MNESSQMRAMTQHTDLYESESLGFRFETLSHRSTAITVIVNADTKMLAPEKNIKKERQYSNVMGKSSSLIAYTFLVHFSTYQLY